MKVLILMGSDTDLEVMKPAVDTLDSFEIKSEVHIASAHRTPAKVVGLVSAASENGFDAVIAGAGMAAHLAGVAAAHTILPVIGVPMPGGALNGVDALYATVQMPRGIPVATVAVGKSGAVNAGVLAAQILALKYPELKEKLIEHKKGMADAIESKDSMLKTKGIEAYLKEKKKK